MAIILKNYTSIDGDVLVPTQNAEGHHILVSLDGMVYIPTTVEIAAIEAGNPMGLLLTLTYPATP